MVFLSCIQAEGKYFFLPAFASAEDVAIPNLAYLRKANYYFILEAILIEKGYKNDRVTSPLGL